MSFDGGGGDVAFAGGHDDDGGDTGGAEAEVEAEEFGDDDGGGDGSEEGNWTGAEKFTDGKAHNAADDIGGDADGGGGEGLFDAGLDDEDGGGYGPDGTVGVCEVVAPEKQGGGDDDLDGKEEGGAKGLARGGAAGLDAAEEGEFFGWIGHEGLRHNAASQLVPIASAGKEKGRHRCGMTPLFVRSHWGGLADGFLFEGADAVDGGEVGFGAGFDDVGADAAAADFAIVVLEFDGGFALGFFAGGDAAHLVVEEIGADVGDALNDGEHGVDGAVAGGGIGDFEAGGIDEGDGGDGRAVGGGDDLQTLQAEELLGVFELVFDDGFEIFIEDFLLLVAEGFEAVEGLIDGFITEAEAELFETVFEGVASGVFAEDVAGLGPADIGGDHDFVGGFILEHAILMDAGFVGKGVFSNDGLVALHVHAGERRDEA